jgi:hypothetical protein
MRNERFESLGNFRNFTKAGTKSSSKEEKEEADDSLPEGTRWRFDKGGLYQKAGALPFIFSLYSNAPVPTFREDK